MLVGMEKCRDSSTAYCARVACFAHQYADLHNEYTTVRCNLCSALLLYFTVVYWVVSCSLEVTQAHSFCWSPRSSMLVKLVISSRCILIQAIKLPGSLTITFSGTSKMSLYSPQIPPISVSRPLPVRTENLETFRQALALSLSEV